jgi:hypothetical protein
MEMSEQVAREFHEVYERLAPWFGYSTRAETKEFDPESPNGRLMIAVVAEVVGKLIAENTQLNEALAMSVGEEMEHIHIQTGRAMGRTYIYNRLRYLEVKVTDQELTITSLQDRLRSAGGRERKLKEIIRETGKAIAHDHLVDRWVDLEIKVLDKDAEIADLVDRLQDQDQEREGEAAICLWRIIDDMAMGNRKVETACGQTIHTVSGPDHDGVCEYCGLPIKEDHILKYEYEARAE